MDTFDSRALRYTDCYGQRFMRPGAYRYALVPAGYGGCAAERPYKIDVVGERQGRMVQHNVAVHAEGRRLCAEPRELSIALGDLVIWHCPQPIALGYAVDGEPEFFGSHKLVNEAGFSHAFGTAGEYPWADANGSGLAGVVRVVDPDVRTDADRRRWLDRLRKGALVMIDGLRAEPTRVEIVTGQTVFFAIVKSPGVTITDRRVLAMRIAGDVGESR